MKPDIYLFNPTCEIAIANGTVSYMPNRMLQLFEKELDVLPLFFGREKDVVLVHGMPNTGFLDKLRAMGINPPGFIELQSALQDEQFINSPKNMLRPWGWSPAAHHLLSPLKASCSEEFHNLPNANWQPGHKEVYSRHTALRLLKKIVGTLEAKKRLPEHFFPQVCTNIAEIEKLLKEWPQMVIKAPWSSSGRGLQILRHNKLNRSIIQWVNGTFQQQGYVMAEPWLDKVLDFSLQFSISPKSKVEYLGHAHFVTNSNGQYQGAYLNGLPDSFDTELIEFITPGYLENLAGTIKEALNESALSKSYFGYFGIDGLVYRNEKQDLCIHPCIEINVRYTMGTLTLCLNKYLHPKSRGSFRIFFEPEKKFSDFNSDMEKKHPIVMENGLWCRGYFPLVDTHLPKTIGAYVLLE